MGKKAKKQSKGFFGESSAAVFVAVIGLVTAVVSAVLPTVLNPAPQPTPQPVPGPVSPFNRAGFLPNTTPGAVAPAGPNFTYGAWTLHDSVDDDGARWNQSTLKFTEQEPTRDGARMIGFFEWRNNGQLIGREFVTANYVAASRQVFIQGQRVEPPTASLAVGSFSATLSEDERQLTRGA